MSLVMVPLDAFDKWQEKFWQKYEADPNFVSKSSEWHIWRVYLQIKIKTLNLLNFKNKMMMLPTFGILIPGTQIQYNFE